MTYVSCYYHAFQGAQQVSVKKCVFSLPPFVKSDLFYPSSMRNIIYYN